MLLKISLNNCSVVKLKFYSDLINNHKLSKEEKHKCFTSVNSYLGIMGHYKTYNFRKKQIMLYFEKWLKKYFCITKNVVKFLALGIGKARSVPKEWSE